jgi:phage/plasmid-like protein (TIGR03299 family)
MAHELSINKLTGKVEMFYVGDAPWHGMGHYRAIPATSREARRDGGLDWEVKLFPLQTVVNGKVLDIKSHRSVVRMDTLDRVGVVGSDYQTVQNDELFAFGDALVGQSAAIYHTAGAIRGGSRVWVLAKLPESLVVVPGDSLEQYFMIGTSHDGSMALTAGFTTTRVVCSNTFHAAIPGLKHRVTIRHTTNAKERLEQARKVLGIGQKYFHVLGQKLQALSAYHLNEAMMQNYFQAVMPITKNGKGEDSTRVKNIHETLAFLFNEGRGNQLPGVKDTLWAALNSVTEYVDHVRGIKKDGEIKDSWAESALFGSGALLKEKAFSVALEMAGVSGKAGSKN